MCSFCYPLFQQDQQYELAMKEVTKPYMLSIPNCQYLVKYDTLEQD